MTTTLPVTDEKQLVSITQLRQHTKKVLDSSKEYPLFILSNNKLKAVVISPWHYQHYQDYLRQIAIINDTLEAEKSGQAFSSVGEATKFLQSDE